MITFLSSPKPFQGKSLHIQAKAIRSWLSLDSEIEVILYGKSEGSEKIASELGIACIPDIETNEFGTPLFGAIAEHAASHARYDHQVYVNCDILFTQELFSAIKSIPFSQFLIIGQRVDLAKGVDWDTKMLDWHKQFVSLVNEGKISLHPAGGSDYFGFRRGLWQGLPQLAIGRGGYDNALISFCRQKRVPVIDATLSVLALHQFHDYSHIPGGKKVIFNGHEAEQNHLLYKGPFRLTQHDATWRLNTDDLTRSRGRRGDWLGALYTYLRYDRSAMLCADCINILRKVSRHLGQSKPTELNISDICASFCESSDSS